MLDDKEILTAEEGYELVCFYTKYYWNTNRFFALKNCYELEDLISELFLKFLEKKFFEKYNSSITSKKYHVMNGVRTSLIDMSRKKSSFVNNESSILDAENEEGLTMANLVLDETSDVEREIIKRESFEKGVVIRNQIIESISDNTDSKLVGNSPIMGEVKMTLRVIAIHLEQGYSPKQIAEMFVNPKSGKPVTTGRINQLIKSLREFLIEEGFDSEGRQAVYSKASY